jgi:hypothetical protein
LCVVVALRGAYPPDHGVLPTVFAPPPLSSLLAPAFGA